MTLYFVRHAQALYHSIDGSDEARELSEVGVKQAERLGVFIKEKEINIDLILCSPLRRTVTTAEIIRYQLIDRGTLPLIFEQWLRPGMKPEFALSELSAYLEFKHILVIGHQPDLSLLIEALESEERFASVPPASLHALSGELKKGGCHLLFRKEIELPVEKGP